MNATSRKPTKARGRRQHLFSVYLTEELAAEIDAWRVRQEGEPSRSNAIRIMALRVLKAEKDARR